MSATESAWLLHLEGGRISYHDAGGIRTRVLEAGGGGDAVVLIHGLGGHAELFLHNLVPLAERGYRTYAMDLIGHGRSPKPEISYGIERYVDQVLALADRLELDRFHLVGNSLGALVAMRTALAAPDRIRKVINIVGAGLRPIPPTPDERAGWAVGNRLPGDENAETTAAAVRAKLHWLVHDPAVITDEMVAIRLRMNSRPDAEQAAAAVARSLLDMMQERAPGALQAEDLAAFPVPVLYLWSDNNPTTPVSVAEAAHAITPRSELVVFDDCGHWPPLEKPLAFNELVARYLSS